MKVSKTNRFSNHLILKEIGGHGQKLLNESRVLIIGLGGLGCPVLQYAAGSGIGTIGLIDNDNIEVSNLHRQTIFSTNDIGKSKVEVAKKVIKYTSPKWIRVASYWNPRGGIPIDVIFQRGKKPKNVYVEDLDIPNYSGR